MAGEPAEDDGTSCSRWSCDFAVAHAIFGTGFITAPVAVLHLLRRPHSGAATFFAAFAVFFATISLVLCCRFYAELKRPPCPRWLSAAPESSSRGGGDDEAATGAVLSHDHLREPVMMVRVETQAALAGDRIPSYEHCDGAADCAVCLGEVEKGEAVRRLPACKHVFHTECIGMWLRTHATCPVCRRGVVLERPPEVVVDIGAVQAQPGPT